MRNISLKADQRDAQQQRLRDCARKRIHAPPIARSRPKSLPFCFGQMLLFANTRRGMMIKQPAA